MLILIWLVPLLKLSKHDILSSLMAKLYLFKVLMRKYRKSLLSTTIFIGNTFCFPLKYFLKKCLVKLDLHNKIKIDFREIGSWHMHRLSSIKYNLFSVSEHFPPGRLPPGQLLPPHMKFPPGLLSPRQSPLTNSPWITAPGQLPPMKFPPRTITPQTFALPRTITSK